MEEHSRSFQLGFGKGKVLHKALGISFPNSGCPEPPPGEIQERKMPVAARGSQLEVTG